jgi:hypothetical protein
LGLFDSVEEDENGDIGEYGRNIIDLCFLKNKLELEQLAKTIKY